MIKLNNGEKIKAVKRKHILILKLELAPLIIFSLGILTAMILLPFFFNDSNWVSFIYEHLGDFNLFYYLYFLLFILLLFIWKIAFILIVGYYLDCWIITDQRTIHTELNGLFSRYISSIYHHRIQDVSVDVGGVLPTYLNYGNLQIQTAGKFREFLFRKIPEPYETKDILMKVQRDFMKRKKKKDV